MKLFELIIEDEGIDEVFAMSFVDEPAIESYGTYFSDEIHFREIKEEGLFVAPILIPDKRILRVDGEGKPYEVFLSKETIKKLSQMYLKKKYQDKVTIEHEHSVKGVTMVESWIKESLLQDKSNLYGIKVPVGSWMATFKIENEEIKEKFRRGEVSAVSIEGLFTHNLVKASREELSRIEDEEAHYLLSILRAQIKSDLRTKNGKRVEMESYSDYPKSVSNNAKRGIELNEKQGNKCATPVGKVRAQQLAKGEPISVTTIKRMHSYLSRAETYYDPNSSTECGTISYLLWGGKSAHGWSRNKLRELGELEENEVHFEVGVPHYTQDGELWEGPTHKHNDRLMTGETHTEESRYLYHIEQLESQPSFPNSTYPGQVSSGSIAEKTL